MPEPRQLTFAEAIREGLDIAMDRDPGVWLLGEGVADPKAIFGTTSGLVEKYGVDRVMEMPVAENGMTGVAIGSALMGNRPVMIHQRVDFTIYSWDQLINNAAKWFFMYGGKSPVPMVVRMVIGRGWGQGPQHSQSFESVFSHIPGLKVVMPVSATDAKGLMIGAIEDQNPVIFIEHRWLHGTVGEVPEGYYSTSLDSGCRIARSGKDLTVVATSYMVVEALKAAEVLADFDIEIEVIDMRVLRPVDDETILSSVDKTGGILTVDTGWRTYGIGAEIIARVCQEKMNSLKYAPMRLGLPDYPSPSSRALVENYYPRAEDIVSTICQMLQVSEGKSQMILQPLLTARDELPIDQPDPAFTGPF